MDVSRIAPLDRGQVIRKGALKCALAATDSFCAEVENGEVFEVETELNIGGHLITSLDERLCEKDVTLPFVNPATGPVRVKGARPGDTVWPRIETSTHICTLGCARPLEDALRIAF